MSTLEAVRLGISLRYVCSTPACTEFAWPLLKQMDSGKYDECAVMSLPRGVGFWEHEHRTARKRAWKADRLGYRAERIERTAYTADVHTINTSREVRQGRTMAPAYAQMPSFGDDRTECPLHGVHAYGVLDGGELVAYLWMYRAGDLALVSQVLGHADHEDNGVMYLLFREALAAEGRIAPGVCVYNRYDSGTDGLRFLKDRVGFEPVPVEWLP